MFEKPNETFAQRRTFVRKQIAKYSKQLRIPVPPLYFKAGARPHTSETEDMLVFGSNYGHGKEIFINLDLDRYLSEYDETVAHELVHTARPYTDHGMLFDNYVKQVRQGKYPLTKPLWDKFLDKLMWRRYARL